MIGFKQIEFFDHTGIRDFAPDADIEFQRIAVTEEQIVEMSLPTRPTKTTDSRSKNFEGESVEVDAIPPGTLRKLVRDAIEQHVDSDEFERLQMIEEQERETLSNIASAMPLLQRDGKMSSRAQTMVDCMRISEEAPDLSEQIKHGKLTITEALVLLDQRNRDREGRP
jgi:hypothetical protein